MHACAECLSSPTLRAFAAQSTTIRTCDLCAQPNRAVVQSEVLRESFWRLLRHYHHGSGSLTITGRLDPNEPRITLAHQIENDGLLVLSPAVPLAQRNAFLDAVRTEQERADSPANGYWMGSSFGRHRFLDIDTGWIAFKCMVEGQRRFAVSFGERGIPNFPVLLATQNPAFRTAVPRGSTFYRARRSDLSLDGRQPSPEELGAPPSAHAAAARANAAGIRALYVANAEETAIAEVRPHIGLIVHTARCVANDDLRVFDLATGHRVSGLDPFAAEFEAHEREARLIGTLNEEFARPLALHAPDREYAPTQYLAELIANHGYDGIKYRSAMTTTGINYVFFHPQMFLYEYHRSVAINSVAYTYERRRPGLFEDLIAD